MPLSVLPWVLMVAVILLLAGTLFLALKNRVAAAFVLAMAAGFSIAFLHIDRVAEVAATGTSLSIKLHEASDALVGLKKLAALTGAAIINLDANEGVLGGDPAEHRDEIKAQVLETLKEIPLDDDTIKRIADQGRGRDIGDYLNGILSHVRNCILPGPKIAEWDSDGQVLRTSGPPSVDVIESLLSKYDVSDDFLRQVVDDYRLFLSNATHRYPRLWSGRDNWPMFPPNCRFDNQR